MEALRRLALEYPGAQEGVACQGTSLEKRTVKAGDKAFLFLGRTDAMFKLRESLPEATRLASREPGRYRVGGHGWVTMTLSADEPMLLDVLERWIDESYRLLAPAKLVASLPVRGLPTGGSRMVAKERRPNKATKKQRAPKTKASKKA